MVSGCQRTHSTQTDGDRQFVDQFIERRKCEADIMGREGDTVRTGYNETKQSMSLTCQEKRSGLVLIGQSHVSDGS